jgi:hypothetical protein
LLSFATVEAVPPSRHCKALASKWSDLEAMGGEGAGVELSGQEQFEIRVRHHCVISWLLIRAGANGPGAQVAENAATLIKARLMRYGLILDPFQWGPELNRGLRSHPVQYRSGAAAQTAAVKSHWPWLDSAVAMLERTLPTILSECSTSLLITQPLLHGNLSWRQREAPRRAFTVVSFQEQSPSPNGGHIECTTRSPPATCAAILRFSQSVHLGANKNRRRQGTPPSAHPWVQEAGFQRILPPTTRIRHTDGSNQRLVGDTFPPLFTPQFHPLWPICVFVVCRNLRLKKFLLWTLSPRNPNLYGDFRPTIPACTTLPCWMLSATCRVVFRTFYKGACCATPNQRVY